MKSLVAGAALLLIAGLTAAADYGTQRVVYHLDSGNPHKHAVALSNIENHLMAVGKDRVDIRVVLHGASLSMLEQARVIEPLAERIRRLRQQGVQFLVGRRSLLNQELNWRDDLYEVAEHDLVDSGIIALIELQQAGYQYIKP